MADITSKAVGNKAAQTTEQNEHRIQNSGSQAMATHQQTQAPSRRRNDPWGASPFALMRNFTEEIDRIVDSFGFGPLRSFGSPEYRENSRAFWSPQIEMTEQGGKLIVRADLPGLRKEDVKVEVEEGMLSLQGERRQEQEEKREGFYHSERTYGSFHRRIPLPEGVETKDATATFKDGVLEIALQAPSRQQSGRRQIEIG